jgi:hypothetical protein
MWRRVAFEKPAFRRNVSLAFERTGVSEESIASVIRVIRTSEQRTASAVTYQLKHAAKKL